MSISFFTKLQCTWPAGSMINLNKIASRVRDTERAMLRHLTQPAGIRVRTRSVIRKQSCVSRFPFRPCSLCLFVLPLLLSVSVSVSAQSLETAFQIVEHAVADGSIPGAAVLIMQHGKVIEQRTFGDCEIDPTRPFEEDTICWIASLTKPITATAAMKLVELGKLQLDTPIENYLPQFSKLATNDGTPHSITIRQLMSHTSGIPASVPLREPYFFTQRWFDRTLTEVVDAISQRSLDFAPGSQVNYSNAAPYVLGRIIEVNSGKAFGEFLQSEIFDPLQMDDTGFSVAADATNRTAVIYRREAVLCQFFVATIQSGK